METDVVVIGSGGAGLTAALTAASKGADVVVLECSNVFGGTTAMSFGSLWMPNNPFMRACGIGDSREGALTYLRRLTFGMGDDSLLEAFADNSNRLLDFLGSETALKWSANVRHPDYHPEFPGARQGGRTIQGDLYDTNRLGEYKDSVRAGPICLPVNKIEMDEWGNASFARWNFELLAERVTAGIAGLGRALIGELLEACLKRDVRLIAGARGRQLARQGARVTGVVAELDGHREQFDARAGVVLASGGFEWNGKLVQRFLGLPALAPTSAPTSVGDGLLMAMEIGAALGNMTQAWWSPAVRPQGELYDGQQVHWPILDPRSLPGSIIVNRQGKRFVNEATNYNDICKAFVAFDPAAYQYQNLPCFLVFDERFRRSYAIASLTSDQKTPSWMAEADSLEHLARKIGIDETGLRRQVQEFNRRAADGVDISFHRGESAYDHYRGDNEVKPNPNLRPLGPGPYYAAELLLGTIGTKAGPLTDRFGRVLDTRDQPIHGLFAAGNAAAAAFGPGYPGAGSTLGAGMTFGFIIGQSILDEAPTTEGTHA